MLDLRVRTAGGGTVTPDGENGWTLTIPEGGPGAYRWAQLDDHMEIRRSHFHWQAPVRLSVRACANNPEIAGTWGFGFWNDPFSMNFRAGGSGIRLPVLPNAAWFFFASPPNYLAFHDTHPAQGFLAATFSAPLIPSPLLALGIPLLPFLAARPTARLVRRLAGQFIRESGVQVPVDVTGWHTYRLDWLVDAVHFYVDGAPIYDASVSPRGRLGLVVWVDNQYAAFPPDGRLQMGVLPNPVEGVLEIEDLQVSQIKI